MKHVWRLLAGILLAGASLAPPVAAQDRPPQLAQAAPAGGVLSTGQFSSEPDLRCDILEVKRVSGGALLMRWRYVNAAGQSAAGGLTASQAPKSVHYPHYSWDDIYFIDPAENRKYQVLTDSDNKRIGYAPDSIDLSPGEQRVNWAKFPAPPASSAKISITIPGFPPFEDVPVAQ